MDETHETHETTDANRIWQMHLSTAIIMMCVAGIGVGITVATLRDNAARIERDLKWVNDSQLNELQKTEMKKFTSDSRENEILFDIAIPAFLTFSAMYLVWRFCEKRRHKPTIIASAAARTLR